MVLRKFRLFFSLFTLFFIFISMIAVSAPAEENLSPFDKQVKEWAESCRDEVVTQFNLLVSSKQLSMVQLFDTFYVPIPDTDPQKYNTQYDKYTDEILQPVLDKYLEKNEQLVYVVIVDTNGYLPTHNSKYTSTSNDKSRNLTKQLFNGRVGLSAAQNTKPYLRQTYVWHTGETINDISIPITIDNKHWGALRIGYTTE